MNPYAPPTAPIGAALATEPASQERIDEITRQIKSLNARSFLFGLPGIALQVYGNGHPPVEALLFVGGGLVLFVIGLYHYAKMRGMHPAFCLVGLISCVGMLVLFFLPKKCLNCATSHGFNAKQCRQCGCPLGS